MALRELIAEIKRQPYQYVERFSADAFLDFFVGYGFGDASFAPVRAELHKRYPSKWSISPFTQIYLRFENPEEGALEALKAVEDAASTSLTKVSEQGAFGGGDAVALALEFIEQGTFGQYLKEPKLECLFNFCQGYIAGVASLAPADGRAQALKLSRFETWLGNEIEPGRWCRVIRVFREDGIDGLKAFAKLWKQFEEHDRGSN